MPPRKKEPEPTRSGPVRSRVKKPKGGPTKTDLKRYRALLIGLRTRLVQSSRNLADEALKGSGQDYSIEHMADHGTDNFDQSFTLSLLEGETEILREIDDAIAKIDGEGELPFGLCENCAEAQPPEGSAHRCPTCPWIAKGRLDAVPYARLCVAQKEIEEEAGGM
jgi:RNA polymerase-binding transcription factor DksA